ncbi:Uncharacterized conserved protein [Sphingobium sp. YR657]|uniref:DNA -binding domain-containing protein n=1 Tax=Sphingobium sp. YR657 TaxID=1884366 RepID=UPI00091239E6|nr:DUF2285 domain-containing protein [Sphingobium sp. YR657]SHL51842.1 Uncharacterized conserved protein [Sphingobium sp. YR657]
MFRNGACAFAEAADRGASVARLLWDHCLDPMVIRVSAQSVSRDDPEAWDIGSLGRPVTIFKDALGEEVLIGTARTAVRLSIAKGTLLDGPVRLIYQLSGRHQLSRRLLALRQLEALMRLGRVPRRLATPAVNSNRSVLLVRTLDAMAIHNSARSIAAALFGQEEVDAKWMHESDYLRMQTRRLISRARYLANGGYISLLHGSS